MTHGQNRIIAALDVSSKTAAMRLHRQVRDSTGLSKVGLQLYTAVGPRIVEEIVGSGGYVFLDLKFNDIPHTVGKAAKEAAKLGVKMFTVHASAGVSAMEVAVQNRRNSHVIAVTVLTSLSDYGFARNRPYHIFGQATADKVLQFAYDAKIAGVNGIVCSPQELVMIRKHSEFNCLNIITPGIREKGSEQNDQRRVMTLEEALGAGANYVVVGRPFSTAPRPRVVAERFAKIANRLENAI